MRKTLLTLSLAALFTGAMAAPSTAGPVPTTKCELERFLGHENVQKCAEDSS